jgi:hypothetical protein
MCSIFENAWIHFFKLKNCDTWWLPGWYLLGIRGKQLKTDKIH